MRFWHVDSFSNRRVASCIPRLKLFSVARNVEPTHCGIIWPSYQLVTRVAFWRTPECGHSGMFVITSDRESVFGAPSRLTVNILGKPF